jgi:ROK family protein
VAAIVGTGLGGGIIQTGRVVKGAAGMAGELGHVPIPLDGLVGEGQPMPACNCGQSGDAESVASLTGIQNNLLPYWLTRYEGHPLGEVPIGVAAKQVRKYGEDGDEMALAIFRQQAMALGRLFTMAANFLDPDAYFLGGGVVEAAPHFRDWFFAEVRAHTVLREEQARVAEISLVPDLDMAGARGSAYAARDWLSGHAQPVKPATLLSLARADLVALTRHNRRQRARLDRVGLLLAAAGIVLGDYLSEHALFGALVLVLEDQPAHLEVELLWIRKVIDVGERLILPGGLQDELAEAEEAAHRGSLEGHVRHLGERHHVHLAGDDARREHEPLGGDDEVGYRPLPDLHRQVQEEDSPQDPDNQEDDAVAARDGVAQPARESQPDEDPENGLDQDGGVLVDGDDLALVRKKVPVYRGRHRVGVRYQPHPSAWP